MHCCKDKKERKKSSKPRILFTGQSVKVLAPCLFIIIIIMVINVCQPIHLSSFPHFTVLIQPKHIHLHLVI